jgi:hypothetical protein
VRDAELLRQSLRARDLVRLHNGGSGRDRKQVISENVLRDAQKKRRIDPARKGDEGAVAARDDLLEALELRRGPASLRLAP